MIEALLSTFLGDDPARQQDACVRWWKRDDAFDAMLQDTFGAVHADVAAGGHLDWLHTPRSTLAYIALTDQISRNIHRGTPAAFACDGLALAASMAARCRGWHAELSPVEQLLLNMPLMHSEDRHIHGISRQACWALAREVPEELRPLLKRTLDYCHQHADIIERFGRYPHRNAILGRISTTEEEAFLRGPNSGF